MKASILIVDDDPGIRRALADRIRFWGHQVVEASDGGQALEILRKRAFDLILLDLNMPGMSGLELLSRLDPGEIDADKVVLTAHGTVEKAVEAIKLGAADFLLKPADFDLLRSVVDRSLERRRLVRANAAMVDQSTELATMVPCASPAMRNVLELARRAAASEALVLITGESGTGKQVLAESIHRQSARRDGPFVHVNCVAITDALIESTLFGHEKGSFTGAISRKPGKLETAAGGTAFLDEIGDISPALQSKLLHFLESGEMERVGGNRTISADCRVIAATNRDLHQATKEGRFREDLFFRLNVINLHIPPLRERREDIPMLSHAFLTQFCRDLNRDLAELAPETARVFSNYSWPGNVRQLRNAVERMVVLASGPLLTPDLLPPELQSEGNEPSAAATDHYPKELRDAVRSFKRSFIRQALETCGGNKTRAADRLGLQRTHLSKLVRELEITD